ncbi:hypothetical protein WA538_001609 [Blastocystis sp. DL]
MFENKLESLSKQEFEQIYRDKGSPHTILQLLPDECQQIFNLLFCVTVPVLHDMIVQSFIRSRGVLGDDSKPQEIVDKNLSLLLQYHVLELYTVTNGTLQYVINPVFRQTYSSCIRSGDHCQWTSENVKEFKASPEESIEYCRNIYNNNIAILMNPTELGPNRTNKPVVDLFLTYGLLSKSSGGFSITGDGYRFLLSNFHEQSYSILRRILRTERSAVPFFTFLFNLRHALPYKAYRLSVLTPEQQTLLQRFQLIGLLYTKQWDDTQYFYVTPLGTDLLFPNASQVSEFGSSLRVRSSLKLVIESNFKVYALGPLEENKLSLQIMAQFMEVRAKLPNMVAFLITRDSIVQALRHEIPASQIIAFLEEYSVNDERMKEADAKLEKNNPGMRMNGRLDDSNFRNEKGMYYKIPMNVMDHIFLWDRELNRLVYNRAVMYRDLDSDVFNKLTDRQDLKKFILYHDAGRRILVVKERGKAVIDSTIHLYHVCFKPIPR